MHNGRRPRTLSLRRAHEQRTSHHDRPRPLNFGDAPSAPASLVPVPPPAPQAISATVVSSAVALPASAVSDSDISTLGQNTAGAIDNVSRRLLEAQRAGDTAGMGVKLNSLIAEAKGLSPDSLKKKDLVGKVLGFFAGAKENLMAKYDTVQGRITTLVQQIDTEVNVQRNRVRDLDDLYVANHDYYVKLGEAAKVGDGMLARLDADIAATQGAKEDAFAAGALAELRSRRARLEKRVDDFRRTMVLCEQTAPQIMQMKDNANALVQTFDDIKTTTIPAWRNIFSQYLISLDQKRGAELANSVYDATDEAIRMQADALGKNTEEIARARQRSVVSIETLEYNQQKLIESLDKAAQIEKEGREARAAAAPRLQQLEKALIERFTGPGAA